MTAANIVSADRVDLNDKRTEKSRKHDLDELMVVDAVLAKRSEILGSAKVRLQQNSSHLSEDEAFLLASTDLFVEKAQRVLTHRADRLWVWGVVSSVSVLAVLGFAAALAIGKAFSFQDDVSTTNLLISHIFSALGLAGIVFAAVKFLFSIAGSMFHEAHILRDRRDFYRFGRLAIYLRKGDISLDELEKVFQWGTINTSSFQSWRPETMANTPINDFIRHLSGIADSFAKLVSRLKK